MKPKQNEAVKDFVSGRDIFVWVPARLCYAVLPVAITVNIPFGKTLRQMGQPSSLHIAVADYMYGLITHKVTCKIAYYIKIVQ